jgi:hypothetical protein
VIDTDSIGSQPDDGSVMSICMALLLSVSDVLRRHLALPA